MRSSKHPLLCELHAHSTWSDGELPLPALVDLYGQSGFDVLCVTDHVWRSPGRGHIESDNYAAYLNAIAAEAKRARSIYDLLVVPGLELSYDDPDPSRNTHVVAIGLETFVAVEGELEDVLRTAREAGAALIAAHPYTLEDCKTSPRPTGGFAASWQTLKPLVDRIELFNRDELFAWTSSAGVPAVATGDFHRLEHLETWKTLLPCPKDARDVVDYLASPHHGYLARVDALQRHSLAA